MEKCNECGKDYEWGKYATKVEKKSGFCPDCWDKPFSISSVCRADLQNCLSPEEIAHFGDGDMAYLAEKMGDAHTETGYWDTLDIIAKDISERKKG